MQTERPVVTIAFKCWSDNSLDGWEQARHEPAGREDPQVEVLEPDTVPFDEGCLSVPGFNETVDRPKHVMIRAIDGDGNAFEEEAHGLLAVCIQHEMDHLKGKLFVDYLSSLKRDRIRKKLKKQRA